MAVSVQEYNNKFKKIEDKIIKTTDGVEFKIKAIDPLSFLTMNTKSNIAEMMKFLIINGTRSPKIVEGEIKDCIDVNRMPLIHIKELSEAISELSELTKDGKQTDFLSKGGKQKK